MAVKQLLSNAEMNELRMRQLMDVFTKADSTLSGMGITCTLDGSILPSNTPAGSANNKVYFNPDCIPPVNTAEGLVNINGLNYHELAHILYTPQSGNSLVAQVNAKGQYVAFNVLEDQRIETLLTTKYPSIEPYLVATIAEYFVNVPRTQHKTAYPYLYGRQYLPAKMLAYFKHEAGTDAQTAMITKAVEVVIDEYKTLNPNDPKDEARCLVLIDRFHQMVGTKQQHSPFGHGSASQAATGSNQGPNGTKAQQAMTAADIQAAKDAAAEAAKNGTKGKGKQEGDEDGDDGDGDDGEGSGDKGGGSGIGAGTGDPLGEPGKASADEVKEAMRDLANKSRQAESISEDLRRQRDAMNMKDRFKGTLKVPKRKQVEVDTTTRTIANQFGKQLARLVAESDPGWHTHRATGRLNVKRVIEGGHYDEVFDEWDSGKQDADSIEMVVMLDSSGSMSHLIGEVALAGWILKAGTESLGRNANVSVLEFEDNSRYVYPPLTPAPKTHANAISVGGGTRPWEALQEAMRILANSSKKRKLLLTVSDGGWSGPGYRNNPEGLENEDLIRRMNAAKVTTAAVFLQSAHITNNASYKDTYADPAWLKSNFSHECQVFAVLHSVAELVTFGKRLVRASLAQH